MIYEIKKYSVLVVSSSDKMNDAFRGILPSTKYSTVMFVNSIASAKRAILDTSYDFVIINAPLPDDLGMRFAIDLCTEKNAVCMLMVKNELYEKTNYQVTPYGVFTIAKPTSVAAMEQALSWLAAARERLLLMDKKTDSIEEKMKVIRIVNRAKWLLIENLKMTEAEAHKYIEKQAMDNCVSKKSVAEDILKTYQK